MRLQPRDRRALLALAAAAAGVVIFVLISENGGGTAVVGPAASLTAVEARLERVRRLAASAEGKEQVLAQVADELAERERGVLQADTAAQAQAQLLEAVRRVARGLPSPVQFGTVELGQQLPLLGEDYGQVMITVPFTCRIEDLLNLLADLTRQPDAIATTELRIAAGDPKHKTINVRLTVAGVVPRRLVPEKKGVL